MAGFRAAIRFTTVRRSLIPSCESLSEAKTKEDPPEAVVAVWVAVLLAVEVRVAVVVRFAVAVRLAVAVLLAVVVRVAVAVLVASALDTQFW
jgi:hypothetical protein